MHNLISTKKKQKKVQMGNESSNLAPKSLQARKDTTNQTAQMTLNNRGKCLLNIKAQKPAQNNNSNECIHSAFRHLTSTIASVHTAF